MNLLLDWNLKNVKYHQEDGFKLNKKENEK